MVGNELRTKNCSFEAAEWSTHANEMETSWLGQIIFFQRGLHDGVLDGAKDKFDILSV